MYRASAGTSPCFPIAFLVLLALALAVPAGAQIPDEFTNLQILDEEIEKSELIGIMRGWTQGLGVRCTHCHVGPDNLQGMDFATDEKATKKTARKMVAMVDEINQKLLAGLPVVAEDGRAEAQNVSCFTCHRGMTRPPREIVVELLSTEGADSAVARFQELTEAHENAGKSDLRPTALFRLARTYAEQRKVGEARGVLASLAELAPDFADGYALLAQIEMQAGNLEPARAALEKALEIDPENQMAAWLKSQMPAAEEPAGDG